MSKKPVTDEQFRSLLTSDEYHILREKGTEPPFSGKYLKNKKKGYYLCRACGSTLFDSHMKYDSGSGWPSFFQALNDAVDLEQDAGLGMGRTEVVCKTCESHLGHVFDDGPKPTGKRYCINSLSLTFKED